MREILFRGFHKCDDGDETIYVDGQEQVYCFSALIMYDDKLIDEYKLKKYEIKEVLE